MQIPGFLTTLLVGVALTAGLTGCASNQSRLDAEAEALAAEEAMENDPGELAALADEAWRFGAIKTAIFNYNRVLEIEPENIGVRYRHPGGSPRRLPARLRSLRKRSGNESGFRDAG